MAKNLFVAGLAYSVTDRQLEELFSAHGTVQSAKVIIDRDTGQSKGFGFVEMSSDDEAAAAITALTDTQFEGRSLTVNEARPKTDAPRGGFGGGGGSYGGNRNGYNKNGNGNSRGGNGGGNFNRKSR